MTTIDQSTTAQIAQPNQAEPPEKILRFITKPNWMIRKLKDEDETSVSSAIVEKHDTFYRKAIEWTHRADKVINLILGYLLAVASVLGFMDVLSNGEVLGSVPYLFYIWLAIMGLGVDFQIFLVIGRIPDLARTVRSRFFRFVFFVFNLGFLGFLCYMSIIIAAVFTQHRDMPVNVAHPSSITLAMSALGIDSTRFVYERAALATLLLVLMAVDRTMERWRMHTEAQNITPTPVPEHAPIAVAPVPVQEEDKLEKLLLAMQQMNAQNLQAMQTANQQALRMTVEQITNITIESIKDSFASLPIATQVPLLTAQSDTGTPITVQEDISDTDEMEALSTLVGPIGSTEFSADISAENSANGKRFGEAIQKLATEHPDYTGTQIASIVGCTEKTVYKWLKRITVPE